MVDVVRVKLEGKWYTVEVGDLAERPVRAMVDGYPVEVEPGEPNEERTERETSGPGHRSESPSGSATGLPRSQRRVERRERPRREGTPPPPPPVARPAGAVVESPPDPAKVFSAPMPGTILSMEVSAGDQVVTGDTICVLEAMKMQQHLRADWSGVVKNVLVVVGQQVLDGTPIIELE